MNSCLLPLNTFRYNSTCNGYKVNLNKIKCLFFFFIFLQKKKKLIVSEFALIVGFEGKRNEIESGNSDNSWEKGERERDRGKKKKKLLEEVS